MRERYTVDHSKRERFTVVELIVREIYTVVDHRKREKEIYCNANHEGERYSYE